MSEQVQNQQKQAEKWFKELRNQMVGAIQKVDGSTFHISGGQTRYCGYLLG